MRFRVTVRGDGVELRGYFDDNDRADVRNGLVEFSDAMRPYGVVLASVATRDYDPFRDGADDG